MKHRPKIADVMTAEPETVHLGQPISDVYMLLQSRNFHHVPVVDGRTLVGIISATDILKLVYDVEGNDDRMLRSFLDHQFTIEDAMSIDLVTSHRDKPLRSVVDQLADGNIHSVLVVDDEGRLDGIITSTDLIRQLRQLL